MAETIADRKIFSLHEVMQSIQRVLSARYQSSFWVKAEMNKLNFYPLSGHCYPELVEKQNDKVIAQMRCNLWKNEFDRINQKFLKVLGEPLKEGGKMLLCVTISFDSLHGLSLRILDIDPAYSLGELQKEKSETLEKLKSEDIINRNRELTFPVLPKRIAVISVETSKGYADFSKVIEGNAWGYGFFHMLFPAVLQGEKAVESIIYQLRRIRRVTRHFDVVAIIRGGGGEIGLSCFNNYNLSREIALFPIPVITGIGHATNETVCEMIASKNAITPTELADFLIQKFHNFSIPVQKAQEKIVQFSIKMLRDEKLKFFNNNRYLQSITRNMLMNNANVLQQVTGQMTRSAAFVFRNEKHLHAVMQSVLKNSVSIKMNRERQAGLQVMTLLKRDITAQLRHSTFLLQSTVQHTERSLSDSLRKNRSDLTMVEKHIQMLSPENVLRRGYTITRKNGRAITDLEDVNEGDVIETFALQGTISSKVETIKPATNG